MKYTKEEIAEYVAEHDVKFIRMAFCDIFGKQKNISIMPTELDRAFTDGIAVDASAIPGFGGSVRSDLFLHPDSSTLSVLPWRPEHGRVVRMFCSVKQPDGTPTAADARSLLLRTATRRGRRDMRFPSERKSNFICSVSTNRERRPKSPTIRRVIWTLRPRTKEKTSAAKSV